MPSAIGSVFVWASLGVGAPGEPATDVHSHARPESVRVRHLDLDLDVDFERQKLHGSATLAIEYGNSDEAQPLVLDSRDLAIAKVETSADGRTFAAGRFDLGKTDAILGTPVTIPLPARTTAVRVHYATGAKASGLQWLGREMTASKKHPFLFTQSQAIHARSWIPLQDSPGVRVTYTARIRTPKGVLAVMSAENDPTNPRTGEHRFAMKRAVPPYLIALAVGDLEFKPIGERTGVYAEPAVVEKAAAEFADLEKMVEAVERVYGPYRWGRYDVLVLPPSFPFGGMENPRLTFLSPTILAGDRSLVSLLAHELAHSWSGNLVTNATWSDFWLNEGFTVYLERRIVETVFGPQRADMEAVLGRKSLEREMADLKLSDQVLHIDLKGRDPDDAVTDVPYEKGALFLKHLEAAFGREAFDAFLKGYFDHFAFRGITTADFVEYLDEHLLKKNPTAAARVPVAEWITKPGLPGTAPEFRAQAFEAVERLAKGWLDGTTAARELRTADWSTQEWLHFLNVLPKALPAARMKDLDDALGLTKRTNAEILFQWLLLAVRHGYEPAYPRLEEFLTSQGRRKFLKPLYDELVKTPAGKERARAIYAKARPTYHPIAVATIDAVLGGSDRAAFEIATQRADDRVRVVVEKDRTAFEVTSPFGIGRATVERTGETWPATVVLRLRLKGLERFRATNGTIGLAATVSIREGRTEARVWKDDREDAPLDDRSPFWLTTRILRDDGTPARTLPLADGYFEIVLPKAFFEGRPKSIALEWIDFYRN